MPRPSSPPTRSFKTLRLSSSPPSTPTQHTAGAALEDSEDESTSPTLPPPPGTSNIQQIPPPTEEQRTAALQRELSLLKSMNSTLTHLHATLATSKNNLHTLQSTVSSSAVLLDTWTRILSQAEHNARLIADTAWEGAGQDAVLAEREESERRLRTEREREERERRERERTVGASAGVVSSGSASAGADGNKGFGRGAFGRGTGRVLAGGRRGLPGGNARRGAVTRGRGQA